MKISTLGAEFFQLADGDGQTDTMDIIVAFRNIANTSKNY
jgi:hypothetical protein